MIFNPQYPKGATPLDPDELNGLIPQFISIQSELNVVEQENILNGKNWALKYKKDLLDETFARTLHKKMYQNVWKWAGQYRKSQKTIGIEAHQIPIQIALLMKDAKTWIELKSYPWPELLARFHHRLVFIHPFVNGNGRHARLHTELLANRFDQRVPSWGAHSFKGELERECEIRKQYIECLQMADQKKFNGLISFIYS
jgi:Fic-DOC domain mobile mystery protein B